MGNLRVRIVAVAVAVHCAVLAVPVHTAQRRPPGLTISLRLTPSRLTAPLPAVTPPAAPVQRVAQPPGPPRSGERATARTTRHAPTSAAPPRPVRSAWRPSAAPGPVGTREEAEPVGLTASSTGRAGGAVAGAASLSGRPGIAEGDGPDLGGVGRSTGPGVMGSAGGAPDPTPETSPAPRSPGKAAPRPAVPVPAALPAEPVEDTPAPNPPAALPEPKPVAVTPKPAPAEPPKPAPEDNLPAKPRPLSRPLPSFPRSVREQLGAETSVSVSLSVSASGEVTAVSVTGSSGLGALDEAAAAACRRWRFSRARAGATFHQTFRIKPL